MHYTFLYTFWSLKCSVSFITYRSVLSASSSGGISSSSAHGQSWDKWDLATLAITAREFIAVVGVVEVLGCPC